MDFEEYHMHLETATDPLDRAEEIKILKRAGSADWALVMRALISGGKGLLGSGYLLEKLEGAKARSFEVLDSTRRQEYFRLKHSALAARVTCVEDCT